MTLSLSCSCALSFSHSLTHTLSLSDNKSLAGLQNIQRHYGAAYFSRLGYLPTYLCTSRINLQNLWTVVPSNERNQMRHSDQFCRSLVNFHCNPFLKPVLGGSCFFDPVKDLVTKFSGFLFSASIYEYLRCFIIALAS